MWWDLDLEPEASVCGEVKNALLKNGGVVGGCNGSLDVASPPKRKNKAVERKTTRKLRGVDI